MWLPKNTYVGVRRVLYVSKSSEDDSCNGETAAIIKQGLNPLS